MSKDNDNVTGLVQPTMRIKGLGMGQLGSFKDYAKVFSEGCYDISDANHIWDFIKTPSDIAANINLMTSNAFSSMVDDQLEDNLAMHSLLPDFSITEVQMATLVMNILGASFSKKYRVPEAMVAIYGLQVKETNSDIEKANNELAKNQNRTND